MFESFSIILWPTNIFFFVLSLGQRRHPERLTPSVFRQGLRVRRHPGPDSVRTSCGAQAQAWVFRVSKRKSFTLTEKTSSRERNCGLFQPCCVAFHSSPSLKEFLPKEYIKQRGSEKKVFQVSGTFQLLLTQITAVKTSWQQALVCWTRVSSGCRSTKTVGKWLRLKPKWSTSSWRGRCGRTASPSSWSRLVARKKKMCLWLSHQTRVWKMRLRFFFFFFNLIILQGIIRFRY